MELRIGDDEVVIVMRDPTMLGLGRTLSGVIGNRVAGTAGAASPLVGLWDANLGAFVNSWNASNRRRKPTRAAAPPLCEQRSAAACAAAPADRPHEQVPMTSRRGGRLESDAGNGQLVRVGGGSVWIDVGVVACCDQGGRSGRFRRVASRTAAAG